jgi:hypothetical protein
MYDPSQASNPANAAEAQAQPKYQTLATKPSFSIPILHRDSPTHAASRRLDAWSWPGRRRRRRPELGVNGDDDHPLAAMADPKHQHPAVNGRPRSSTSISPGGQGTHLIPSTLPTSPTSTIQSYYSSGRIARFLCEEADLHARFCWTAGHADQGRREEGGRTMNGAVWRCSWVSSGRPRRRRARGGRRRPGGDARLAADRPPTGVFPPFACSALVLPRSID